MLVEVVVEKHPRVWRRVLVLAQDGFTGKLPGDREAALRKQLGLGRREQVDQVVGSPPDVLAAEAIDRAARGFSEDQRVAPGVPLSLVKLFAVALESDAAFLCVLGDEIEAETAPVRAAPDLLVEGDIVAEDLARLPGEFLLDATLVPGG
ncbi:MAG: hypothetical protein IT452_05725 [Planctomycetia bacterium]|nr:hypothetical protein [Planctomycetia bacterium]